MTGSEKEGVVALGVEKRNCVDVDIVIRCGAKYFTDCIGFEEGGISNSNVCASFQNGLCRSDKMIKSELEKSPYNPINAELCVRQRDFDTCAGVFLWDVEEHCPECRERDVIVALINKAAAKAKELTKKKGAKV